ncbi:hypothetical protein A4X13_0g5372 [Tilletia indica]|uniref:Choline/carnitine acyltransferase domain-containing protein n=1 Tax=Tilletia indica TaxID=43049 RepID=A0A177TPE4_9BASI|nr:hypothetical protein A4X13_0g5372 [Tilletia indica]
MAPTADPASAPVPANKTFKDQDKLPKLPIPDLKDTCNRYLASLQYLQSQDEHDHTKKVVQDFLENEGPKLHADLQEYASQRDNYVEAFWEGDYLAASDSVVLNLNPFFILEDDPTPSRGNQMMRTASLILASLSFVHDLRTGQLEPDNVRGTPLDMHQYTRLFGTARIPTANGCRLEGYSDESSHIVVLRRGQMYWFEVLDENHRPLFTERALLANLQAIVNDADKLPRSEVALNALGVLTTEKRKAWSDCRERLEGGDSGENNRRCLKVVDSALFVVCMDDWEPPSSNSGSSSSSVPENRAGRKGADKGSKTSAYGAELCNNMLCGTYQLEDGVQVGTCTNRWYDKLQIIVCSNGAAGINFEHTGVDGHTVLRFVADIYTELIMRFAKSINSATQSLFKAKTSPYAKGIGGKRPILFENSTKDKKAEEEEEEVMPEYETSPRKLEWDLTPPIRDAIQYGETRLSDLICQNECQVLVFSGYGKSFLTRHRFSPDAFVQMSFQAAYCKLYGRPATTYEPAMVKHFRRGRTEAIRTVQGHSVEFTRTFFEKGIYSREEDRRKSGSSSSGAKSGGGGPTPEEKIGALRKACEGHTKLTRECSKGMGHDRHLYAMYELWKKMQVQKKDGGAGAGGAELAPALFRDSGYQTLSATIISTSNCGNPALRLFGFGPVNPAGFGIGYIIKDDEIAICASSKHLQTARFLDTLNSYLEDVGDLIIETYKAANSRVSATFIDHSGRECDVRTGRPLEGDGAKAGGVKKRVTLVEQLGGSNGYDDFERGVHDERPSLVSGKAAGGSTMGSAGYGFFDAGGGAGVDKTGGVGGGAGSGGRRRKGQGVMEEILGVGKTVLFSEYS